MAGGVALNCVANGKIAHSNIFENIFIQPAAGDSGGAMGAALAYYHLGLKHKRVKKENWQIKNRKRLHWEFQLKHLSMQ